MSLSRLERMCRIQTVRTGQTSLIRICGKPLFKDHSGDVRLQLGRQTFRNLTTRLVKPDAGESAVPLILLPEALVGFSMPDPLTARLQLVPEKRLIRIGPWITVLCSDERLQKSMYGLQLAEAARRFGIILQWRINPETVCPHTELIYNRIGTRTAEQDPAVQRALNGWAADPGVHVFNWSFLEKSEVDRLIASDRHLDKHRIPGVILPKNADRTLIRRLLSAPLQNGMLNFLKPSGGGGGFGIRRIRLEAEQQTCTSPLTSRTKKTCPRMPSARIIRIEKQIPDRSTDSAVRMTPERLISKLQQQLKKSDFLMQQAIELIRINGCCADFRLLTQKNGNGEWVVTSAVARIAASPDDWLCNQQQGASTVPAKTVLSAGQLEKLRELARRTANVLEKKLNWPDPPAEFGIDLAIDRKGNYWILEANAKPSRLQDRSTNPGTDAENLINAAIPLSIRTWCSYVLGVNGYQPARIAPIGRKRR